MPETRRDNPAAGIAFILLGVLAISVNDMLIKRLSGGYPLHQMVFVRSAIGLVFTLALLQWEGGWRLLRTDRPGLHLLRGLLMVAANMTFFAAIAVMPLADATALFFVAPLFITLLSIPLLGETVGPWRLGAVAAGFCGVLLMQRPWAGPGLLDQPRMVLLLPVIGALLYALNQLMTRRLGLKATASALAAYVQGCFLVVASLFWLVAGDGRYAEMVENDSLHFLLRAWVWPAEGDLWLFLVLGLMSGIVGYCLAAAYRAADAAVVAPFEYVGLPMAVIWGWLIFGEWPGLPVWAGMILIAGSGIFVFLRERMLARPVAAATRVRRRY
ncbi:MAG: DMT family transporter [Paracoccaceae bacterium]